MLAKRLQRELRETLKTAKRGEERIFLEVFAGDANLSRAFQRRRCTVFCIDIRRGPHHDLRCREVFDTVQGWLRAGLVWCLWLGTPCNSFSKARRAPPGSAMPSALRTNHVKTIKPDIVQKQERFAHMVRGLPLH